VTAVHHTADTHATTTAWEMAPTGWTWTVYVDGYLRAHGSRCATAELAQAFAAANLEMILQAFAEAMPLPEAPK
jgi:hypothetical protein